MKKMSKEAQMQANGGKELRITCQGVKNGKWSTGCGKSTQSKLKWVAEAQMGIHQSDAHHYLCTYVWITW